MATITVMTPPAQEYRVKARVNCFVIYFYILVEQGQSAHTIAITELQKLAKKNKSPQRPQLLDWTPE